MDIEVCTSSIEDVLRAEKAGATRIELCMAMEVLGVTPTIANYKKAKEISDLPILAYIRPRAGGFVYTDLEFEIMMLEARDFYKHGARDFVFGILTEDNKIDKERCKKLINFLGEDCTFGFHKAFDYVEDKAKGVEDLIELGFSRILTSGGPGSTLDNLDTLKSLMDRYGDQIEIMPGGGITAENVERVLEELPVKSIHLSAKMLETDTLDYTRTDVEHLRTVVDIVNSTINK